MLNNIFIRETSSTQPWLSSTFIRLEKKYKKTNPFKIMQRSVIEPTTTRNSFNIILEYMINRPSP